MESSRGMEPQRRHNEDAVRIHEDDTTGLVKRITDDAKAIVEGEVFLARYELVESLRKAGADAAGVAFGGIVALIALGLLCVAAVAGLEPAIPALWLRLLIMAGAYFLVGGIVAAAFTRQLKRHIRPEFERTRSEARKTVVAVREELRHARR